ncbi:DUF397 domain-containing protein [Saccharopolyspora elongata]|uniref:DUF397 domain-containing protein n=1 Tax=Saccharopolyspora elongata TaxID=2530387 RepID=A0A4R4XUG3_9PSEU|nr:DUF397 domain-containing protein [Saccharopolyspora elongata]TDD34900.1 DUF397 domain-containing protein [Saccharopolyspora elongata]
MTTPHAPEDWRKSRFSGGQTNCVEVGRISDGAAVRDSKNRAAGHLTTDRAQWSAFIGAVKDGRFER